MPEILMEFSSVKEASFSILRSLPWVGTWLGYAHPGLRRRTFRAWWNSESGMVGDRNRLPSESILRCKRTISQQGVMLTPSRALHCRLCSSTRGVLHGKFRWVRWDLILRREALS